MDLNKLKALAQAATQDGWELKDFGSQIGLRVASGYQAFFNTQRPNREVEVEVRANAAFFGAAQPAAVLELIALAEHQEAELEISQRECGQAVTANAELRDALVALGQAPTPADPLDWPLPCDVAVGCGTHQRGTTLRALVAHMGVLHGMAMAATRTADPGAWLAATQSVMPDGSQRDLGGAPAPGDAGSAP